MMNQFTLRQSGNIGQEIISPRGNTFAWTTNAVFGELIVRILNTIILDDESLEDILGDDDRWHERLNESNSFKTALTNHLNSKGNDDE